MKNLTAIAATALAVFTTLPILCATTSPAHAQEWRDEDDQKMDREMIDAFLDRLRARQDLHGFVEERREGRQQMRELLADLIRDRLRERVVDSHERGEGRDEDLRGRLRERLAERMHGNQGGDCYFFTRSLRDEDGDFLILVRRRICRD